VQESEKRRKTEEHLKNLLRERMKPVILGGPDYEVRQLIVIFNY